MTSGWRAGTTTLIVLSMLLTLGGFGLGLPSLVISIVAMTRGPSDGPSATRLAKVGWVCFGVAVALVAAVWIFLIASGTDRGGIPVPVEDI